MFLQKCFFLAAVSCLSPLIAASTTELFAPYPERTCVPSQYLKHTLADFQVYGFNIHGLLVKDLRESILLLKQSGKKVFLVTDFLGKKDSLPSQSMDIFRHFDAIITAGDVLEEMLRTHNLQNPRTHTWGTLLLNQECLKHFNVVDASEEAEVLLCGRAIYNVDPRHYSLQDNDPHLYQELTRAVAAKKIFVACPNHPVTQHKKDHRVRGAMTSNDFAQIFQDLGGKVITFETLAPAMLQAIFARMPEKTPLNTIALIDSGDTRLTFRHDDLRHMALQDIIAVPDRPAHLKPPPRSYNDRVIAAI